MRMDGALDLQSIKSASFKLQILSESVRTAALQELAEQISLNSHILLADNEKDCQAARENLSDSQLKRLELSQSKLDGVVSGIRQLAAATDPIGKVLSETKLAEALILRKIQVPLGVVAVIFESRPDVAPQLAALALRSGNALILKGGKESSSTNRRFIQIFRNLKGIPANWVTLIEDRSTIYDIIKQPKYVDLVIPRGSNSMVRQIMEGSLVPVLGHADGICHVYIHGSADISSAVEIIIDAKCQHPSACNSVETVLVDESISQELIFKLRTAAKQSGLKFRGCSACRKLDSSIEVVNDNEWSTEYGDLTLALKVVPNIDSAIEHINNYGSHHTDAIVARDNDAIRLFQISVDSSSVMSNCSTRFADGYRYGFGAEVGISTSKIHARGPVGVEGLLSYKYVLEGAGQTVRPYVEGVRGFTHSKLNVEE